MREIIWVGNSLKILKGFPEEVKDGIGYALHNIQRGLTPRCAKPLKGFKLSVIEIVSDYDTNTYRSIYTTKIGNNVYVLHCFQKKSSVGIKTPKHEIDLIRQRLRDAETLNNNLRQTYEL